MLIRFKSYEVDKIKVGTHAHCTGYWYYIINVLDVRHLQTRSIDRRCKLSVERLS